MQDVTQHYAKILHNTEQDSTTLDNVTRTIFGKGGEKYFELLIKKFKPNTEIVSLGDSGCRVNPCPACGHNDCFTFNPENCVYNCFGCGVKGNVMNIAKHFTSDLTEAGQALKEFTGIDLLSLSSENQELIRKRKLFRDASEIYNKQLILNDTAYDYLIKVRRRKPETIDIMQTGFCADNKAFAEDLEQMGCI
jgi:hypothetical protein